MLTFVAVSGWTLLGSLSVWARVRPRGASTLIGVAVISVAQVVGLVLIMGWLGQLRREPILIANVLLDAVLISVGRRGLIAACRDLLTDACASLAELVQSKSALVLLLISASLWIWILTLGILLPPTDYDGLAQHLPIAAFHLQSGNLASIDTPYRGIRAYPANGSLLMAWSILIASNDTFVDLMQWPFWLLGALSIYHLARCVGATRRSAVLGTLVFTTAPIVAMQARAAYVDLMLTGLVLSALALILDRQLPVRYVAAASGCAVGVVIGLKYVGAVNAALLLGLLVVRIGLDRRSKPRQALGDMLAAVLPIVALGTYWYLRNWLNLGNPFWPMSVQVAGVHIFSGVWTTDSFYEAALPANLSGLPYLAQLWTVWREPTLVYSADVRLGGLGPLWLTMGLPCLLFFSAQSLGRRQWARLVLSGFAVGVFLLTPANWHTRYVMASVALSGVAVALVLDQLDRWPQKAFSVLLVCLAVYSLGLIVGRNQVTATALERFARLPEMERRVVFADQVAAVQPAMRWFDRNVPDGATVAYGWGGVILYPFWGQPSSRKMIYVPPSAPPFWFDALHRQGANYLIVRQNSEEAQTAARDPRFRETYSDSTYAVYFVQP
jgi:hypothetical protein